eukprot:2421952-Rhodomonas_salina.1
MEDRVCVCAYCASMRISAGKGCLGLMGADARSDLLHVACECTFKQQVARWRLCVRASERTRRRQETP